jgi:DEAD/DEAH box helicase domain-containing protein
MKDIFYTEKILKDTYLSYLRSPFRIRNRGVAEERDTLLSREGSLYQPLYLEFTTAYELSGQTASEVALAIGVPEAIGQFLETGLFPEGRQLYTHQKHAWKASKEGKSVIVTSGTGSGKTESFLAPLLGSITEEMLRSGERPGQTIQSQCYWRERNARQTNQRRVTEGGRQAAIRGLILYPLNALVEDQLARLREACDKEKSRKWFETYAGGDRIWFGRYTGETPISGRLNDNTRPKLRRKMEEMDDKWEAAVQTYQNTPSNDPRRFFQDPEGSEMWSRWDMQETPPDILITNYSMLNIMLMRDLESDMWSKTKDWLEKDERNIFHLVIDELHSYRGTAGSEVAFLLRTLLARLGVSPTHRQVRILATSASLEQDSEESLKFLEDFFGRNREEFEIIPGNAENYSESDDWRKKIDNFAQIGNSEIQSICNSLGLDPNSDSNSLAKQLVRLGVANAIDKSVIKREGNKSQRVTLTLSELATKLNVKNSTAEGIVRALAASRINGRTPLSIRGHLFFHAYGRVWACSNPNCTEKITEDQTRRVGKLYDYPLPTCNCGGRVLELLVCQQCGETLLGGHVQEKINEDENVNIFLSPDTPDFKNAPDKQVDFDPTCNGYRVFWPAAPGAKVSSRLNNPNRDGSVQWQQDGLTHSWKRASFDCFSAQLYDRQIEGTGYGFTYLVNIPQDSQNPLPSAFPSTCPHCGNNWSQRKLYKNLIRRFGGGFARSAQVLSATLLETSPELDRRTIVFTDSRSDAARLSTSIKTAHYKELLRTLASSELKNSIHKKIIENKKKDEFVKIAEEAIKLWKSDPSNPSKAFLQLYDLGDEGRGVIDHLLGNAPKPSSLEPNESVPYAYCPLREMRSNIFKKIIDLGMNPGGPLPSVQGPPRSPWWKLLDENSDFRIPAQDQFDQRELIKKIQDEYLNTLIRTGLQASSHRDFESLGYGFLWVPDDFESKSFDDKVRLVNQATATVIRILVEKNKWDDDAISIEANNLPREATTYLTKVANVNEIEFDSIRDSVTEKLGDALQNYRLLVHRMVFCIPMKEMDEVDSEKEEASLAKKALYVCSRCGAKHLHPSAGVCWVCNDNLEKEPSLTPEEEDSDDFRANYYRLLVQKGRGNFTFASYELTGQTTSTERRNRQRRFQDVFIEKDESPKFQKVNLLSVTTTMEAGVDIGSLRSVVLGNMPPVRFNYQQRVGRCGRRGTDFSIALTLSRGRSHDDYYFAQPRAISSDRTPAPFIDVNNRDIALRVIRKEVLLKALHVLENAESNLDSDVHGPFGNTRDWPVRRDIVASWLQENKETVEQIVSSQVEGTSLDKEEITAKIIRELVSEIDKATEDPSAQEDQLGRHLAYRGLFPMFGFPTRVRSLYLGGLDSEDSVDREMERAIGSFSPGSQVVWEDRLYTAIGCEHRIPGGYGGMERTSNPLGPISTIGLCKRCLSVTDTPSPECSFCGETNNEFYQQIEMCQPRGFVARGDLATDYRERFEFSPSALTARLAPVAEVGTKVGNATLSTGSSKLYRVNDNSGNLFEFVKKSGQEVWFTKNSENLAIDNLRYADNQGLNWHTDRDVTPQKLAIGQISNADSTIVSLANEVGAETQYLNLSLTTSEGRSAWFSAVYLLQRAAGQLLDVDPEEFIVGVQEANTGWGQIFITDKLENGSGYTKRISQPEVFNQLLNLFREGNLDSFGDFLRSSKHEEHCATACYRCLLSYGNSPTHPLLDWRIGLDTIQLLSDGIVPSMAPSYWERYRLTNGSAMHKLICSIFTGQNVSLDEDREFPVIHIKGRDSIIVHHPLVSVDSPALRDRMNQYDKARRMSLFQLIRAPWALLFPE